MKKPYSTIKWKLLRLCNIVVHLFIYLRPHTLLYAIPRCIYKKQPLWSIESPAGSQTRDEVTGPDRLVTNQLMRSLALMFKKWRWKKRKTVHSSSVQGKYLFPPQILVKNKSNLSVIVESVLMAVWATLVTWSSAVAAVPRSQNTDVRFGTVSQRTVSNGGRIRELGGNLAKTSINMWHYGHIHARQILLLPVSCQWAAAVTL